MWQIRNKKGPPSHRLCLLYGDPTPFSGVQARGAICCAVMTMSSNRVQDHQGGVNDETPSCQKNSLAFTDITGVRTGSPLTPAAPPHRG